MTERLTHTYTHGHSDWVEVISYCGFNLHFSDSDVAHLFLCLLVICVPFWRNVYLGLLPTL